jgi:LAS superfamily LD-carboxypeptidase LdcB
MPCTSRHHWGTDMDLISLESPYFEKGQGLKEYKWLVEHAGKFGFCQVYDDKKETKRSGYELEKWHWSYMPLSSIYLKKYNELVNYSHINGFTGSKLAKKINVIEDFVNGINKKCE